MLILDVKTRWSSTHQMLRRSLDFRKSIFNYIGENEDLCRSRTLYDRMGSAETGYRLARGLPLRHNKNVNHKAADVIHYRRRLSLAPNSSQKSAHGTSQGCRPCLGMGTGPGPGTNQLTRTPTRKTRTRTRGFTGCSRVV
ncbi:hypothetical protein B0H10DRAFT_746055, partial [Mycena sp. CBHHK59/15]